MALPPAALAVLKSFVSVQALPFHVSVLASAVPEFPPKIIPAVDVPAAPCACLPVFKSPTSVQDEPLDSSD